MRRTNFWVKPLSSSAVQPGQFTKIVTAAFVDLFSLGRKGREGHATLISVFFSTTFSNSLCEILP